MTPGRVWFVAERFEALAALLMARGYALDAGARDPNEWNELAVEEPSRGIVRMKGRRLSDAAGAEQRIAERFDLLAGASTLLRGPGGVEQGASKVLVIWEVCGLAPNAV